MGKNSGTTRSGGSSNPKGAGSARQAGTRMNNYMDFRNSERLNAMLKGIEDQVNRLEKIAESGEDNQVDDQFGLGIERLNNYEIAARAAARGLRDGRELAEELIDDNIEDLRKKLYDGHDKASKAIAKGNEVKMINSLDLSRSTQTVWINGRYLNINLVGPRAGLMRGSYDIVDNYGESWGGIVFDWTEEGRRKAREEIKKQLREISRG